MVTIHVRSLSVHLLSHSSSLQAQQAGAHCLLLYKVRQLTCKSNYYLLTSLFLSFFSTLALPPPEVVIRPDGSTTAGDVYTLTCNATVVENLFVEPDIQWLYTNDTTVGGTNITIGTTRMTGNVFTRNLTFCPLHTSHGRQYTCRTSINVSAISLSGISSESSINVTVRSKNTVLSSSQLNRMCV